MYECKKCGKTFVRKDQYDEHMNIASNCVKPILVYKHVCYRCNASYTSLGNLNKHLNGNSICRSMFMVQNKLDDLMNKNTCNNVNLNITKNKQNIQQNIQNIQNILQPIFVKHGKENLKHITKEIVLALLNMDSFTWICTNLVESAYFNKMVPENNNWCLVYPNNENAAVVFDHDKNKFKRESTKETINEKFRNMMELLIPVLTEVVDEDEIGSLNRKQKRNLFRLQHFSNVDELSDESSEIYNSIHKMAFKQREIPMETWRKNGYKGNHLSIKF